MRSGLMMGAMGLLALLLGGCASAEDPRSTLEEHAAAIDSAAQEVLALLAADGMPAQEAKGVVDTCRSEPSPGVSYRAGVSASVGDDPVAAFGRFSGDLVTAGWQRVKDSLGGDGPSARFQRDGLRLDVKAGGFRVGETLHDADIMTLSLHREGGCVTVPDGGFIAEVRDLEKQILPRE